MPSRVNWQQGGARCSLEQRTRYPDAPEISLLIHTDRAATFTVYLRVPAWAGRGTSLRINGKPFSTDLKPGIFAPLHREWKDGDRIEYFIDMPLRLQPVDPQHPNIQALLYGPQTLFAIDASQARFTRQQLFAARQSGPGSQSWSIRSAAGPVTFRTFSAITNERYRLYHEIET